MRLKEVAKNRWPTSDSRYLRVFKNDKYLVQTMTDNGFIRITVNLIENIGTMMTPKWAEGISWDNLQNIKDSIGFKDRWCVECYPPTQDIINVANMRHLWVLEEMPKFGWKRG